MNLKLPVIVQLCTFTIAKAIHGGQRRVKAIHKALDTAGFSVKFIGMYCLEDSPQDTWTSSDFARPSRLHFTRGSMLLDDFHQGLFLAQNDVCFTKLAEQIRSYQPSVLQIEHPWLWPVIKRLRQDFPDLAKIPFVYSSHNIEWRLKGHILDQYNVEDVTYWTDRIKQLETEAAQVASLVIAVTDQDAEELKSMGASRVLVLKNGMEKRQLPSQSHKAKEPFALFVASGHPPNVKGFMECLGPFLSFLPPTHKIRIVGGVISGLRHHHDYQLYSELNESRLECLGEASEEDLLQSLSDCRCIILPITESAGSNLKTAEALLAGKPIIATSTALRGFEEFRNDPFVQICDDQVSFKRALQQKLMQRDENHAFAMDREREHRVSQLTWPQILAPLPQSMRNILHGEQSHCP